jgi:hypothetical protein
VIRRHADLIVQNVTDSKVNGMAHLLNGGVFGPCAPEQLYEFMKSSSRLLLVWWHLIEFSRERD